jgi:hypothetical protein
MAKYDKHIFKQIEGACYALSIMNSLISTEFRIVTNANLLSNVVYLLILNYKSERNTNIVINIINMVYVRLSNATVEQMTVSFKYLNK